MEVYRGRNAVHSFLERLLEIEKKIKNIVKKHFCRPLVMSKKDETSFRRATVCHICNRKCKRDDRVRDHCHVTGKYRGLAHKACNTKYKVDKCDSNCFPQLERL